MRLWWVYSGFCNLFLWLVLCWCSLFFSPGVGKQTQGSLITYMLHAQPWILRWPLRLYPQLWILRFSFAYLNGLVCLLIRATRLLNFWPRLHSFLHLIMSSEEVRDVYLRAESCMTTKFSTQQVSFTLDCWTPRGGSLYHHFRTILMFVSGSSQGKRQSPCRFDGKLGHVLPGFSYLNSSFCVFSTNFLHGDKIASSLSAKP